MNQLKYKMKYEIKNINQLKYKIKHETIEI